MAKKNFSKGIDNVFSPTVPVNFAKVIDKEETKEVEKPAENKEPEKTPKVEYTFYNLKYPKELKKRIQRFLIDNEGIDIKDIFTEGAVLYLDKFKA